MPRLDDGRVPVFVGLVTLGIGAALALQPERFAGLAGLDGEETMLRAIGVADLALVPGLLAAPRKWPWMAARAALNVPIAGYLHRAAPHSSAPAALRAGSVALAGLTAIDGATAVALRSSGR